MHLIEGGSYALMGTTTAPAFDFQDFEIGKRHDLIDQYQEYSDVIEKLTVDNK